MSKARTSAAHFFDRAAMHSTKGSRKGYVSDAGGENPFDIQNAEQDRQAAVKSIKRIEDTLEVTPRDHPLHRKLRAEKRKLELYVNAIRPKQTFPGLQSFFMECAQEVLSTPQFTLVLEMAKARYTRAKRIKEITKEPT